MADQVKKIGIVVELRNGELVARGLKEIGAAGDAAKKSGDNLNDTLKTMAGLFAALKLSQWERETINLAARYQTLGVALDVVGRGAGKTAGQLSDIQQGLQKTGISAIEARANMLRLIQAQIDLKQANDLARVAQNAAVIANENSSETFARMVHGIQSGHVIILRNIGLNVDFERGYKKMAETLGTTAEALTDQQRMQARVNVTMEAGTHIAGAYEAALGTAGKQIKSAERYLEDMRVKAGQAFLPEYTKLVFAYADALKWLGDNAPLVTGAMVGLAGAVVGLGIALKGSAVIAFIASLASAPVVISIAAIAALATVLGSAATEAALARKEAQDYTEQLKHMNTATLEHARASAQDELRNGFPTVERYKQLTKYIADYTKQIEENKKAQSIANKPPPAETVGADATQKLNDRAVEIQQLTAMAGAYRMNDMELEKLKIHFEALERMQKDRKGMNATEIAALGDQTREWERLKVAELEAAAARKGQRQNEDETRLQQQRIALDQLEAGPKAVLANRYKAVNDAIEANRTLSGQALTDRLKTIYSLAAENDVVLRQAVYREHASDVLKLHANAMEIVTATGAKNTAVTKAQTDAIADQIRAVDAIKRSFGTDILGIIEKLATRGVQSWGQFLGEVESLTLKYVERINTQLEKLSSSLKGQRAELEALRAAAQGVNIGVTAGVAGYNIGKQTGDRTQGALGGIASGALLGAQVAGPWGAVVGGLAGAAGGLLGAASAQKEAAKAAEVSSRALALSVRAFSAESQVAGQLATLYSQKIALHEQAVQVFKDSIKGGMSPGDAQAQYRATSDEINAANTRQRLQIFTDFWSSIGEEFNALSGPAGAYLNEQNAIIRKYDEQRKSAAALGASTEDLTRIDALRDQKLQELIARAEQQVSDSLLSMAGDGGVFGRDKKFNDLLGQLAPNDPNRGAFEKFVDYLKSLDDNSRRIAAQTESTQFWQGIQTSIAQQHLQIAQDSLNVQQQQVDGLEQTVDALRKFGDSLKLSNLSPLNSAQRYQTAEGQFEALVKKAFAGDQDAARAITSGAADSFLTESRSRFASSVRYAQDYNRVQGVVTGLEGMFGDRLEKEDKVLTELKKQTALEKQMLDTSKNQLVEQLVQRANDHPDADTGAQVTFALRKLGFALGGMVGHKFAYEADFSGNRPGQGNTGVDSTIYNPAYQAYLDAQHGNVGLDYQAWLDAGQPSFARGGNFGGGVMRVGERGPELVATGAARIHTAESINAAVVAAVDRLSNRLERRLVQLIDVNDQQRKELAKAGDKAGTRGGR